MMDVDFVPEHLVIVGGSYIGLEFAQMYRRFGSEVSIVEMAPRLIQREDADVSQAIDTILEAEGVHIRLNAKCIALEKRSEKVAVNVDCSAGDKTVVGSHVLIATGRKPNTDDLGLKSNPVSPSTSVATSRWMIGSAPMCLTSTPWAIAMGAVLSRTQPTTTTRSSRPIFWTATRAG